MDQQDGMNGAVDAVIYGQAFLCLFIAAALALLMSLLFHETLVKGNDDGGGRINTGLSSVAVPGEKRGIY